MKSIPRLTDLEISIMKILWDEGKNLTIQEITGRMEGLSVPSITQAMKHLINKKAVVVAEHVLVSNVYARTFKPCFNQDEFLQAEYKRVHTSVFGSKKFGARGFMAALFNNSSKDEIGAEEINELQKIIDAKKKEIEGK